MDEQTFYCICGHACIALRVWDDGEVGISIYEQMHSRTNWKFRLEHIWHILTRGDPYDSDMILEHQDIIALRDTLNQVLEKQNEIQGG